MNNPLITQRIYIFFLALFAIELYYFFIDFFITGLFAYYGYSLQGGLILLGIILTHSIILLGLILLSYGVMNRKPWTRKFMMFFLLWAMLWSLWGIIVGNNLIINGFLTLIYLLMIFYLKTNEVKEYFSRLYQYGKYILYTKLVTLKSGLQLPIYFFSSHTPKSGHPAPLPEGYIVKENETSHMPYLKKQVKTNKATKKQRQTQQETHGTIYVVNSSHNDAIKGSWAVKDQKTFFSSHPTKRLALKKAREIALKQHTSVLVQDTHGKFSYGFKPKRPSS